MNYRKKVIITIICTSAIKDYHWGASGNNRLDSIYWNFISLKVRLLPNVTHTHTKRQKTPASYHTNILEYLFSFHITCLLSICMYNICMSLCEKIIYLFTYLFHGGDFWDSVFFFYNVASKGWTYATRLGDRLLYLLNHPTGPF